MERAVPRKKKYSLEFRQQALERMKTCSSVAALARELGIRRKRLYQWRAEAEQRRPATDPAKPVDSRDRQIARLEKRTKELEQLIGRQTAEIDFFKGALRKIKARRQVNGQAGGAASTTRSDS
jgi:hypothetical protein